MRRSIFESEHDQFRASFAAFVAKEISPHFADWEKAGLTPHDLLAQAGQHGFTGMAVPEQYGGGGTKDFRYNLIIAEEIANAGVQGTGAMITLHNDVCTPYFLELTNDEQKARWLPGIASGEKVTAIAMTEPGIGSDLASMTTTAPPASTGARRPTLPASTGEHGAGGTALAAWRQERSAGVSSVARLRLSIAALQGRHATARKRTLEMRPRVESARSERTSLEHWFARQVGTRAASLEEARRLVRLALLSIGRRAIADRATFGAEFDADRARVAKLESAAESAARDVTVHEAALDTHDPRAFRAGLAWLGIAAALLIALVVWRATRVVAPPPATVPAQSSSH